MDTIEFSKIIKVKPYRLSKRIEDLIRKYPELKNEFKVTENKTVLNGKTHIYMLSSYGEKIIQDIINFKEREMCGGIYAIRVNEYVKIGATQNFKSRFQSIDTLNPYSIKVEFYLELPSKYTDDHFKIEKKVHELLNDFHHKCEWFLIGSEEIKMVKDKLLEKFILKEVEVEWNYV